MQAATAVAAGQVRISVKPESGRFKGAVVHPGRNAAQRGDLLFRKPGFEPSLFPWATMELDIQGSLHVPYDTSIA